MPITKGQIIFGGEYIQSQIREAKEGVKSEEEQKKQFEKLEGLVERSQDVLFKVKTVFPFDLFPDCLCIDENKVSIISKTFMGTEHVRSVLIGDITDVTVQTTPFLSTLEIIDSSNVRNPIYIKVANLKTRDAVRARRIIQGLIAAKQSKVDISGLDHKELVSKLEKLGEAKGGE